MDLLANVKDEAQSEGTNLLDSMTGDGGKAWVPEQAGDAIQGVVVSVTTTESEYTTDAIPVVALEVDPEQGGVVIMGGEAQDLSEDTSWRVTGYASVLRNEINQRNPQPGDLFAAKFFGEKTNKSGKATYKHYGVATRRMA